MGTWVLRVSLKERVLWPVTAHQNEVYPGVTEGLLLLLLFFSSSRRRPLSFSPQPSPQRLKPLSHILAPVQHRRSPLYLLLSQVNCSFWTPFPQVLGSVNQ